MRIINFNRAGRLCRAAAGVWLAAFYLAACQLPLIGKAQAAPATQTDAQMAAASPVAATAGPKQSKREVLSTGDTITVAFSDVPGGAAVFEKTIKDDGTVTLSYNEKFVAAGKTPGALEKEIRERYVPRIFQYLTVTVKAQSQVYYVGGEVRSPNRYPYIGPITVMKAIQSAGDFTDFARRRKVQITRGDGRVEIIDCKKVIHQPSLDLEVYPGDKINVPRRYWPWQ